MVPGTARRLGTCMRLKTAKFGTDVVSRNASPTMNWGPSEISSLGHQGELSGNAAFSSVVSINVHKASEPVRGTETFSNTGVVGGARCGVC